MKRGAPKKENPKKHLGLRLSKDVIDIIRSKENQVQYIEYLVRMDDNFSKSITTVKHE